MESVALSYLIRIFVFFLGSMVGSFLNVCIFRMPREQSVVKPRSFCPHCKKTIPGYDNIPLFSYLILRGKCRNCKQKISFQYFVVELLTALCFLLFYYLFGISWLTIAYLIFVCGLIIATFIDFNFRIIPDEISVGGMVLGLIFSLLLPQIHSSQTHLGGLWKSFLGVIIGGGLVWLTAIIGDIIFFKIVPAIYKMLGKKYYLLEEFEDDEEGPATMGGGDIKLMAMVGAFIGWQKVTLAFFLAPFFGAFIGLYVKFTKKTSLIAYGPYLVLASLISLLYGDKILYFLFYRYF